MRLIQSILLDPSGSVWTDWASNVSRLDPSGAYWIDGEHLARNRKDPRAIEPLHNRSLACPFPICRRWVCVTPQCCRP